MPDEATSLITPKKNSSIILVGNSNVGKSVIFGYLTGKYVTVANYPGTTVALSYGKINLANTAITITDTPGTNSFIPQSEDEKVTRDVLLTGEYGTVLQIADSKNLRRGLYITLQLAEMGLPCILVLNMADETQSRGISIDVKKLEKALGIPVISTTATQRKGLPQVKKKLQNASVPFYTFKYPYVIEEGISRIEKLLPEIPIAKRSLSLMLLAGDTTLTEWLTELISIDEIDEINGNIKRIQKQIRSPLQSVIAETRLGQVDKLMDEVYTVNQVEHLPMSTEIGKLAMHPVWGIPAVLLVLYIAYWFVGLFGAGTVVDFFKTVLFGQYINPLAIHLFDWILPFEHVHTIDTINWSFAFPLTSSHEIDTGLVFSREVITTKYIIPDGTTLSFFQEVLKNVHDFMVGEYGVITMALTYSFAIVFPIVGTFFLLFSILEDSGYLPRLAVMLNKVFKFMGLNGKAVLPMILGLGCDTMATMTARIMESRKERVLVTLLLALGIPCSAQLGVLLGMIGGISFTATLIWLSIVVGVLVSVGFIASKVLPGESSPFILELPPIRKPQLGNIIIKTIARMEWYFREVIPLFILGTVLLFFLDLTRVLEIIRDFTSPLIVSFLGLPSEVTEAFLVGFLRRDYGAVYLFDAAANGLLNPNQILISMITITLFVPCIANVFIIIKELGLKTAVRMVAFIFPFAFLISGIVNLILNLFNIRL
ncbi:hypothetical protein AMJ80_07230 [bacterium SM23_31]|nr:MAG: hypothetical protein AMJ80_07230 [bacterium SM23_31]